MSQAKDSIVHFIPSSDADVAAKDYATESSSADKKEKGQFFTPIQIAQYMASMSFCTGKSKVRILDPGAGTGILGISLIEQLVDKCPELNEIDLVVYETDLELGQVLENTTTRLCNWAKEKNVKIDVEIRRKDFVLDNANVWHSDSQAKERFDYIISNPPYFKLKKDDPRSLSASKVVHGQPNIYALFLAISSELLTEFGELIFITPRSFASGTYFQKFRDYFFDRVTLNHVHLFRSRSKAFKKDKVLQETIIYKATKYPYILSDRKVRISISEGLHDLENSRFMDLSLDQILDLKSFHKILYLPTNSRDLELMSTFRGWKFNFKTLGIQISTGPVVSFRSRDVLKNHNHNNHAPLIWLNHVKQAKLTYPLENFSKDQYILINEDSEKVLLPNKNYVLLRRFSSKDDPCRLVSAPYFSSSNQKEKVGIENKLNYIYRPNGELSQEEAWGVSALLSSELFDDYFRIFNGNTQVSATELRQMSFPSIETIRRIGRLLIAQPEKDRATINNIVNNNLTQTETTMSKIQEAQQILEALKMRKAQQNEISALTLLALCGIKEGDDWSSASRTSLGVTKGIMKFMSEHYGRDYAANTRETIRKDVLHHFYAEGLALYNPDDPSLPVTSPKAHYAISDIALEAIRRFGTKAWTPAVKIYLAKTKVQQLKSKKERDANRVPLTLADGTVHKLSPGEHNEVQVAIVEQFTKIFAPNAKLLYLGDTEKKDLIVEKDILASIGIKIGKDTKLPDVVFYDAKKNWIYLIEVVTSRGNMTPTRIKQLEKMLKDCEAGRIYVTAFPSFAVFKRHSHKLAWDTEVWLADAPEHMIHFNGDRFIGPRDRR